MGIMDYRRRIFFLFFPTIHDVLKAEKKLKTERADYELVHVPCNLSSDCGVCIRLKGLGIIKKLGGLGAETCYFYDGKTYNKLEIE